MGMSISEVRSIVQALAMATTTGKTSPDLLWQVENCDVPVGQHLVGLVGEDRTEVYKSAASGVVSADMFVAATYRALTKMEDE